MTNLHLQRAFEDGEEGDGVVGEAHFQFAGLRVRGGEVVFAQHLTQTRSTIFRGIDDVNAGSGDAGDGVAEEGIMGAAEDERVDF